MQKEIKILSKEDIEIKTYFNNRRVEKIRKKIDNFDKDPQKSKRLEKHICKTCMYIKNDSITLSAFHHSNCGICNKEIVSSNSDIDCLCEDCARENNLCKHCGAIID